jgi:hypothetical protein
MGHTKKVFLKKLKDPNLSLIELKLTQIYTNSNLT